MTIGKIIVFATFPNIEKLSMRWDSEIYQHIAVNGYTSDYYYAFSPLYPLLIRLLYLAIGNSWIASLIVTNIFSYICPLVLYKLFGYRVALAFELFPTYLVFTTIPYSDVISTTFLAISLLLLEKRSKKSLLASSISLSIAVINRYVMVISTIYYFIVRKYLVGIIAIVISGSVILSWYWLNLNSPLAYLEVENKYWGAKFTDPFSQALWILNGPITNQPWTFLGFIIPPYLWLIRNLIFEAFYIYGTIKLEDKKLKILSATIILPNLFLTGTPSLSIPRFLLQDFLVFLYYGKVLENRLRFVIYLSLSLILTSVITLWQMQAFFS
ncbi:MAG: hypothetical protein QXI16_01895 [Sulfolobaceae archaeon]